MNAHSTQAGTVAVYSFRTLEDGWESSRVSRFKATREAIGRLFVGDMLEGTVEWVPAQEVDDLGRWQRLPTAWRELT